MEKRTPSRRYEEIARGLIAEDPLLSDLRRSKARIAYLASDRERMSQGRTVYGACERIPGKYRWTCDYDFAIVVYEPNCERLSDDQIRVLLLHELMHVGVSEDGNDESYSIVPHDVEDFSALVDRYGIGWCE